MKTLFLIRHAKSSWDDPALSDKDRPLGDRGRRDAPRMGKRLAKRNVKPDLILSSPARRALTTAEIIAKKLDYKRKDIVVDDRLYASAVDGLLNVIHGLGDNLERVILFGHNPELTELAHRLSGEITHMPTCAVRDWHQHSGFARPHALIGPLRENCSGSPVSIDQLLSPPTALKPRRRT
jgi:phosphohistidine phosphatase